MHGEQYNPFGENTRAFSLIGPYTTGVSGPKKATPFAASKVAETITQSAQKFGK